MKTDVSDVGARFQWNTEGLNGAIQVHVIQGILVLPHPGTWIGHCVTHKPDAIVARIGLVLSHSRACACPSHDGRLHPDSGDNR